MLYALYHGHIHLDSIEYTEQKNKEISIKIFVKEIPSKSVSFLIKVLYRSLKQCKDAARSSGVRCLGSHIVPAINTRLDLDSK